MSRGGFKITETELAALVAAGKVSVHSSKAVNLPGLVTGSVALPAADAKPEPKEKVELLPSSFTVGPELNTVRFVVGVKTASEANQTEWRKRSHRTGVIRRAVAAVVGPYLRHVVQFAEAYHSRVPVRVHVVRLGGRKLDKLANLGSSLKAAEDAVALILGADDGSPLWVVTCDQEPGGPYGVRVTLSLG